MKKSALPLPPARPRFKRYPAYKGSGVEWLGEIPVHWEVAPVYARYEVALGKMLYFEPRLSASDLISCNTCHNLGTGGVDLQETSIGHAWQKGPRNAPTVLNSVFNIAQFWDGRAKDLAEQAKGPMQATVEMSNTPERAVETLKSMPAYADHFKRSFPGDEDPVTFDNAVKAIEAFESALLTPDSPFDKYIGGDGSALTDDQKNGLALFINKGCAGCHNGVNAGGGGYFPFGLVEKPADEVRPPGDKGRFAVTKTKSDEYVYKVPTLRNITLTAPYFHSGKVWDLKEAVSIMGSVQLGMKLTEGEVDSIVDFLGALTVAGSDTVSLENFTVLRYPAQANP